jgi:hypothetical protein
VERAASGGARRGGGRTAYPGLANGQADQRGISKRIFDAACEHHDGRTPDGIGIASACGRGGRACAIPEAGSAGITDGRCGQETASRA